MLLVEYILVIFSSYITSVTNVIILATFRISLNICIVLGDISICLLIPNIFIVACIILIFLYPLRIKACCFLITGVST